MCRNPGDLLTYIYIPFRSDDYILDRCPDFTSRMTTLVAIEADGILRADPTSLIQALIAFWVIGSTIVLLRIGIRWFILRQVIIEETTIFTAFVCWTVTQIYILKALRHGKRGFAEENSFELEQGAKAHMVVWFLYVTAIWTCKTSIILFYMRLTERLGRSETHVVPTMVIASTYLACLLILGLICRPLSNNWSLSPSVGPQSSTFTTKVATCLEMLTGFLQVPVINTRNTTSYPSAY